MRSPIRASRRCSTRSISRRPISSSCRPNSSKKARRATAMPGTSRRQPKPDAARRVTAMNLIKSTGTIGGLTLVSRVSGFARGMLMSRIRAAGGYTDAFYVAFRLPNTFRRLFGEGAFSAGFVPLSSQRLQSGGESEAKTFSEEVLAVFLPTLILFTIVFELIMPLFILAITGWHGDQLTFGTFLTRITFPYLLLISLVSLFSGILNSISRFTAAAFAPALLNLAMLLALIIFRDGGAVTATALAASVTIGGVLQLALLMAACKRAGIVLKLRRP